MDELTTPNQPKSIVPPPIMPKHEDASKSKPPVAIGIMAFLLVIALTVSGYSLSKSMSLQKEFDKKTADTKKQDDKVSKIDTRLGKLEAPVKYIAEQVEQDKFQAVFLNGGQVYFAKISHIDEATMTIKNIYYLRTGSYQKDGTVQAVQGDLSLVKLGSEMHGPEDVMNIERKNVTFWENLKIDGQVAKAIQEYEKSH